MLAGTTLDAGQVAILTPTAPHLRVWELPGAGSGVRACVDPKGRPAVLYSLPGGPGRVSVLDPATHSLKSWDLPGVPSTNPVVSPLGEVFFGLHVPGSTDTLLARLDPTSGTVTWWDPATSVVEHIGVSKSGVVFAAQFGKVSAVVELHPSTGGHSVTAASSVRLALAHRGYSLAQSSSNVTPSLAHLTHESSPLSIPSLGAVRTTVFGGVSENPRWIAATGSGRWVVTIPSLGAIGTAIV